jgi:hypothetical protein
MAVQRCGHQKRDEIMVKKRIEEKDVKLKEA